MCGCKIQSFAILSSSVMLKAHVCISGYHNGYVHTDEADWILSVKSDNWIQVSMVSNNACKHTDR